MIILGLSKLSAVCRKCNESGQAPRTAITWSIQKRSIQKRGGRGLVELGLCSVRRSVIGHQARRDA